MLPHSTSPEKVDMYRILSIYMTYFDTIKHLLMI